MSNEAKPVQLQVENNPFAIEGRRDKPFGQGGMVAVASSRQAQEVQAAMAIAKRFPRDEEQAFSAIMRACQRKGLAEAALYSYPRGGQQITGPSIRLAEALAQSWGNLDFGIIELEQRDGESTVMAYCWDLQTNTRQAKVFQVAHERKAGGQIKRLDDPRDVYELVANQGARRMRSCILGVIPGDVIDAAIEQCEKTIKGGNKEPLIDRIRIMATKFAEDFSVSVPMLEKKLGHKLDATNEQEMVLLRKIYTSLKDGMSSRDQWFELVDTVEKPKIFATPKDSPKAADSTPVAPSEPTGSPDSTQAAPQTEPPQQEQGQSAPTVPNATLGEKPAKPAKAAKPPEPGSRADLIEKLKNRISESGISETEFITAAVSLEVAGTARAVSAYGSDVLTILLNRYDEILAQVS
jgi:hypothetical protein